MSRFEDILDELATLPRDIWPEPTEENEEAEDAPEPVITIVMYDPGV